MPFQITKTLEWFILSSITYVRILWVVRGQRITTNDSRSQIEINNEKAKNWDMRLVENWDAVSLRYAICWCKSRISFQSCGNSIMWKPSPPSSVHIFPCRLIFIGIWLCNVLSVIVKNWFKNFQRQCSTQHSRSFGTLFGIQGSRRFWCQYKIGAIWEISGSFSL